MSGTNIFKLWGGVEEETLCNIDNSFYVALTSLYSNVKQTAQTWITVISFGCSIG